MFTCTTRYGELAARPGVREMWEAHCRSASEGGQPTGRWQAEARRAMEWLTGDEVAGATVRFVCEVQLLLRNTFEIRGRMHEPYKAWRAENCRQLHADFVVATQQARAAKELAHDGAEPLRRACRDDDVDDARRCLKAFLERRRQEQQRGEEGGLVEGGEQEKGGEEQQDEVAPSSGRAAWARASVAFAGEKPSPPPRSSSSSFSTMADVAELLLSERSSKKDDEERTQHTLDEAFVVVCRRGAVRVAAALTDDLGVWRAGKSQRIWAHAWTAACDGGHMPEPIIAALLRGVGAQPLGANQWAEERRQRTPLWQACGNGHLLAARMLIEQGADVNLCCSDGRSALWCAAEWGHVDVVRLLLREGADAHLAQTATGMTPLYVASTNDHADVVLALLRAGAEVDAARSDNGRTPLIAAADKGHDAVVMALLGAQVMALLGAGAPAAAKTVLMRTTDGASCIAGEALVPLVSFELLVGAPAPSRMPPGCWSFRFFALILPIRRCVCGQHHSGARVESRLPPDCVTSFV